MIFFWTFVLVECMAKSNLEKFIFLSIAKHRKTAKWRHRKQWRSVAQQID